jgi:hypothetical protein
MMWEVGCVDRCVRGMKAERQAVLMAKEFALRVPNPFKFFRQKMI